MIDAAREVLAGEEAWIVGGAVRDDLLGRTVVDLDVACADPERAARTYAKRGGGAPFPLSERHGAWRVVAGDSRTVDFTPLPAGIEADLASRDFTINAIAQPLHGGDHVDPFDGRGDLERRLIRVVSPTVFANDPLRLLRAVRLEDELGFRMDDDTEQLVRAHAQLVRKPAGERIIAELRRMSAGGYRRLDELGLLAPLGGSTERIDLARGVLAVDFLLVCALGESVLEYPISRELARYARTLLSARPPADDSPRTSGATSSAWRRGQTWEGCWS